MCDQIDILDSVVRRHNGEQGSQTGKNSDTVEHSYMRDEPIVNVWNEKGELDGSPALSHSRLLKSGEWLRRSGSVIEAVID